MTALNAWPSFHLRNGTEVDKQVAAPAETRTPNLHRANQSAQVSNSSTSDKPIASARKAQANRQNALQSTGPRRLRGKNLSRRNALKNGLFARVLVVDSLIKREDRQKFPSFVPAQDRTRPSASASLPRYRCRLFHLRSTAWPAGESLVWRRSWLVDTLLWLNNFQKSLQRLFWRLIAKRSNCP